MKKINIILMILGFVVFTFPGNAQSQESKLSIDIKVENTSGLFKKDGGVTVEVIAGTPEYQYFLFDELPNVNIEPIIKSSWVLSPKNTFNALKKGTYYILVYDNADKATIEKVEITIQPKN